MKNSSPGPSLLAGRALAFALTRVCHRVAAEKLDVFQVGIVFAWLPIPNTHNAQLQGRYGPNLAHCTVGSFAMCFLCSAA